MEYWEKIHSQFHLWTSPHIPNEDDVDAFARQLKESKDVLLLGLTEKLLPLATCAIDSNVTHVNEVNGIATKGTWDALPFTETFDAIIGDGCLTVFQGPPALLFDQAMKALKPGGLFILRVFIAPNEKEDLGVVQSAREKMGFHAFKWRVAHCLANPYVAVKDLYTVLSPLCDHPTLEIYKDAHTIYYFPTLEDLPEWDAIHFNDSYELAERCPIITWKKPTQ